MFYIILEPNIAKKDFAGARLVHYIDEWHAKYNGLVPQLVF